jgi:O-Antigen ligase
MALMDRRRVDSILPAALVAVGAVIATFAVVSPDRLVLKIVFLLVAVCVALALSPQAFIAVSVIAFAVSTSVGSPVLPASPVPIYLSDSLVLLVALRGALPRDRVSPPRALHGLPTVLVGVWATVMAIAAVRAAGHGVRIASAIRGDLAVAYWLLLYFGFTRVLRERELDTRSLWRNLALAALGLAGWMFLARVLNHPFHDEGLAQVPTGANTTVPRNFGFAGAFVVYPALALVGIAGMTNGAERHFRRWAILASVGAIATLLTLVRGEIFSLALATLVLFWLRPQRGSERARARTALQLAVAILAGILVLLAASPKLGNAIVQRAIPFTHQAAGAKANAEYRQKAVEKGFEIAREHPLGLGVLDAARLDAEGIDPSYLVHSGVANLLILGGWLALGTALLAILSVLRRSFEVPASTPWLHPGFVAVVTMLCFYSISAAALAGDPWVIPLGALAVSLRFTLISPKPTPSQA